MISRYTIDVTSQRMHETEQAIVEQTRYVDSLTDPAVKAIAQRTLTTLEDILLIMRRTQRLLLTTAGDTSDGAPSRSDESRQRQHDPSAIGSRP